MLYSGAIQVPSFEDDRGSLEFAHYHPGLGHIQRLLAKFVLMEI